MRSILIGLSLAFATLLHAQPEVAVAKIADGRAALVAHDMPTAHARFTEAVAADPANQTAAALLGLTRLFDLTTQVSSQNFLTGLGVTPDVGATGNGRNVYNWQASMAKDGEGNPNLPANYNFLTFEAYWQATLLPESAAARANFATVTNSNFLITLSPAETKMPVALNVDYADILMAGVCLRAAEFLAHWGSGQNLDANLTNIHEAMKGDMFTIQKLLNENPNFLTIGSTGERTAAQTALLDMITLYRQASVAIRARPAGLNRLFMLDPEDLHAEAEFRQMFDQVELSLTAPIALGEQSLYAQPLFAGTWSARAQLPTFSASGFDIESIPDATLGGVVGGFTKEQLASALSNPHDTLAEMGWEWVSPKPQGNTLYKYLALPGGKHLVTGNAGTHLTSDNGTTWAFSRIPGVGLLTDAATDGAGKVVAVTQDGTIYLSTDDGVSWRRVLRGDNGFRTIIHANGSYLAMGDYGQTATSADGESWDDYQTTTYSITRVIHTGSLYVAAGEDEATGNALIATSTDGTTWTQRYSAALSGSIFSGLAQGGGRLIALVNNGTQQATSSDGGLNWTLGPGPGVASGIAYSLGQFVAVGGQVTQIETATAAGTIATLGNASVTITGAEIPGSPLTLSVSVAAGIPANTWAGNVRNALNSTPAITALYFVGGSGAQITLTRNTPVANDATLNIALDNGTSTGITAAPTSADTRVGSTATLKTSADLGASWSPITPAITNTLTGAFAGNGATYAVGAGGLILSSTDNVTFAPALALQSAPSLGVKGLLAVKTLDSQLFVGTGTGVAGGAAIVYSADGQNFTAATVPGTANTITDFLKQGSTYYAVGFSGTILTSTDSGANWTQITSSTTNNLLSIAYLNGKFVATGAGSRILTSTTGASGAWTALTLPFAGQQMNGVAYGNGLYVAVGGTNNSASPGSYIATSPDAVTWTTRFAGTMETLKGIVFHQGTFTAVGTGGVIIRSTDGINWWHAGDDAINTSLVSINVLGGRYYATLANTNLSQTSLVSQAGILVSSDAENWVMVPLGTPNTPNRVELFGSRLYTVSANGVFMRSQVLTAPASPVVTVLTPNTTAAQGQTITLAVGVPEGGALTYQWRRGGSIIGGATSANLVLGNIQAGDAGTYTVDVTNAAGTATSSDIVIGVNGAPVAPTITSQPESQTVNVGLDASFFVEATGTTPFTYQWKQDGVNLTDTGNVSGATTDTLEITGLTAANAGTYTVVVTGVGSTTSAAAVLTVDSNPAYNYTTLAGAPGFFATTDNANPTLARFDKPYGVAVDASGNVYVASPQSHTIRKVTSAGAVTTIAGFAYTSGNADNATGTSARFNSPNGVALNPAGTILYVADAGNSRIRKIDLTGSFAVTTLTSSAFSINALAVTSAGDVYYTSFDQTVRKVTSAGVVTVFAGSFNAATFVNGNGTAARFNNPQGIAIDAAGTNLYVADSGNGVIRKIGLGSPFTVTTYAGQPGNYGVDDGAALAATFSFPLGIALDSFGNVLVTEGSANIIRKISPAGIVSTIGGEAWNGSFNNGVDGDARFSGPVGIASSLSDASGTFYLAEQYNHIIRKGVPVTALNAPIIGLSPPDQIANVGANVSFNVIASGISTLSYQWKKDGVNLSDIGNVTGSATATLSLANVQTADMGSYTVQVTSTEGTALSAPATLAVSVAPIITVQPVTQSVAIGDPITLSVTATDAGDITYQWRRNGFAIAGATGSSYAIPTASRGDASVYDVVINGVGGSVTSAAIPVSVAPNAYPGELAFDPTYSASPLLSLSARIYAALPLPDGKWLVGGDFVRWGTTVRPGLARLNADYSLDLTYTPPAINGFVLALARGADGSVYVGGEFTAVNGHQVPGLIRLTSSHALDLSWRELDSPPYSPVCALAVQADGKLLVARASSVSNEVSTTGTNVLTRLNTDGTLDGTFSVNIASNGARINSIVAEPTGAIAFAGQFSAVNLTSRNGIARVDTTGAILDNAFGGTIGTNSGSTVFSMTRLADGSYLLGGNFTAVNGSNRSRAAILNPDGALNGTFAPAANLINNNVLGAAQQSDGKVLLAGTFTTVNGSPTDGLARLTATGTVDTLYPTGNTVSNFGVARPAYLFPQGDGSVALFGSFQAALTQRRVGLAVITPGGTLAASPAPLLYRPAFATSMFAQPGGQAMIFGGMDLAGTSVPLSLAVRVNENGTIDGTFPAGSGFAPLGLSTFGVSRAVMQGDGKVVVAGDFAGYNGNPTSRMLRLNADGSFDGSFDAGGGPSTNSPLLLALSGGRTLLYGIGISYFYNGQAVGTAVVLNEDGSRDTSFNVGSGINANSVTAAYEQPDGKIVMSGNFTTYNGATVNGLVRVNPDGSRDATFSAGTGIAPSASVFINVITGLPDGRLVIAGNFTTYNGAGANRVAVLSSTGTLDGSFMAPAALNTGGIGQVLLQEDGKMIVTGDFTTTPTPYAARLNSNGTVDTSFALRGMTGAYGSALRLFLGDDGSVYVYNISTSYNYGEPLAVARFRGAPVAPTVGTPPASVVADLGSPATLSVRASGTAPYTYQWRKDGVPLADGGTLSGSAYSVLNITSLGAGDAGSYDVIITNSVNSVTSAAATITIGSPLPAITTSPIDIDGVLGELATLSVNVSGQGPFTYQWRHNGVNISGATGSSLSIPTLTYGDAGIYTVTVTNPLGSVTSAPVTITVPLAPGAGVAAIDEAFTRPQFRRAALPGRVTADQVSGSGKIYTTFKNGSFITGANNQRIGAVIRLNADGTLDSSFNIGSFLVDAWTVVPQPNGQVLVSGVAGAEGYESGMPLFRVFRFNSDGSRDTGYNSPVIAGNARYMTLQPDGKLLVSPSNYINNGGLAGLARLNADGSLDASFVRPTFDGDPNYNAIFTTILVDSNNKILIGGTFNTVNGTAFPGVARLNANGTLDGTFVPSGFTRNNGNQIRGLALQTQGANAGKILVAGGTILVGGTSRPVIRLTSTGALDATFTLVTPAAVVGAGGVRPRLLNVLPDDRFTIVSATVTRFSADGAIDGTFAQPAFNGEAFWMDTLADGTVLVASEYGMTVNSVGVGGPIKLTSAGALDGTFTPPDFQTETYPNDFAIRPDGRVLTWGNFDTVNTTPRHGMALLNTDGSLDAFNLSGVANLYSVSGAVLLGDGKILAATHIGSYAGTSSAGLPMLTNGVNRFNADGTVDGTFVLAGGVNAGALHPLPDGRLLTWNLDTAALLNSSPVLQRLTTEGALDGTYAGLSAPAFGAVYRNAASPFRITSIVLGSFEIVGHYPDGRALAVATVPNGSYPAGATSLGMTLVRLNTDGTIDAGFTAPVVAWNTFAAFTTSIVDPQNAGDGAQQFALTSMSGTPFSGVTPQADGSVIVYGSFTSLGGHAAPGIARLTSTGAFDTGFSLGAGPALNTAGRTPLVQRIDVAPDGKLWVTGVFDTFNGSPAAGLVRLNGDGTVDTTLATQLAYRPYLGNGTKVGFGPTGEIYVAGTFGQPYEPFPHGLHRLVGTVTPAIVTHPQSQSVSAGADVTFSVAVTPGLTVAYQWFKGGVAINGATGSTYTLTNVQTANAASYTVAVTNAVTFATSNAAVLSVGSSFAAWQADKFTLGEQGNPAISGPNAVFGQDGLPNLVKYALGLEPKQSITTGLPVVSVVGSDWIYTYTRPASITDVTYTVEFSTNLTTWTELTGGDHAFVSTSGGTDTWRGRYPVASAANIFFRLKVAPIAP